MEYSESVSVNLSEITLSPLPSQNMILMGVRMILLFPSTLNNKLLADKFHGI
jgi:hypothetical protein